MTEFVDMALLITFVIVLTGGLLATVIEMAVCGDDPHLLRRPRGRTRRRGSPRG